MKNSSKIILGALVIILVAAISAGGTYLLINKRISDEKLNNLEKELELLEEKNSSENVSDIPDEYTEDKNPVEDQDESEDYENDYNKDVEVQDTKQDVEVQDAKQDVTKESPLELPISDKIVTIGTAKKIFLKYSNLTAKETSNGEIFTLSAGDGYYFSFHYDNNDNIDQMGVVCYAGKDVLGIGDSFSKVKSFYKGFDSIKASKEQGLIIVNLKNETQDISIVHEFQNNKVTEIFLVFN